MAECEVFANVESYLEWARLQSQSGMDFQKGVRILERCPWFIPVLEDGVAPRQAWVENRAKHIEDLTAMKGTYYNILFTPLLPDRPTVEDRIAKFLEEARVSDASFDGVLMGISASIRQNYELNPILREWLAGYLDGSVIRPKRKRGPDPWTNHQRNDAIVDCILLLKDLGMSATRNDASEAVSACDAVQHVLAENNVWAISYSAIVKIWNNRAPETP